MFRLGCGNGRLRSAELVGVVTGPQASLWAAGISCATAILTTVVLRYFVEDRLQRRRVEREYQYEQRKALREIMGQFDGPLLQASLDLHQRMRNLYQNSERGWLKGEEPGHYTLTTVYRLVALLRLAARLEQRALYLDPSIREERDLITLRYARAFQAVLSGTDLSRGMEYDKARASGHMFRETVREFGEVRAPGEAFTYTYFKSRAKSDPLLLPAFAFVQDVSPTGAPIKWDRLVSLDLLLVAFIERVGFDENEATDYVLSSTVQQFATLQVPENFVKTFLPFAKLAEEPEVLRIIQTIRAEAKRSGVVI